ncbi:hypothetical protein EV361DRAFT_1020934 [Lentinula raphanica]|nr:hypothetical protein EV361DRAFT_1020934 [Lentinula raphanica]
MDAACCSDEETEGRVVGTSPFGDPVLQQTAYSMSSMCAPQSLSIPQLTSYKAGEIMSKFSGCDGVSGTYDIANNCATLQPYRSKCDGTVLKWNDANRGVSERMRHYFSTLERQAHVSYTLGHISPWPQLQNTCHYWIQPGMRRGLCREFLSYLEHSLQQHRLLSVLWSAPGCPDDTKETGGQCGGSQSRKHFDQTTYDEDLGSTKLFSIRRWSSRLAVPPYLVSIVQFNLTQPKTLGEQELRRVNHKSIDDAFDCYPAATDYQNFRRN